MRRAELSLELVCGASDAPPDHPGFWIKRDLLDVHPGHARVQEIAAQRGICIDVEAHREGEVDYSDAYVRFRPGEIEVVAEILHEADFPGDILDADEVLSSEERANCEAVAAREGWALGRGFR